MVAVTSPYDGVRGRWLKGALHVHTTRSDGKEPAAAVARHYRRLGFDFVVLTDHNAVPVAEELGRKGAILVIPGTEFRGPGGPEFGITGVRAMLRAADDIPSYHAQAVASGGFVTFNHPAWHIHHWPVWWMLKLPGVHALEVYNAVIEWLPGAAECTDKWDRLLTSGYRLWGVATDDAHEGSQRGKGWVMVDAAREEGAIVAALKAGRFYASSGVRISRIAVRGGSLVVESTNAQEIRFYTDRGAMRSRRKGRCATYRIREDDIYVRAELYGTGASQAWTNPVFVDTERSRALSTEFRTWYLRQQSSLAGI